MAELNGIIVINKPKGYTSHDAVNIVRGILGTRKVGHTGTLDPNAEGVLPICVGKATKACDMITFSDKEYVAGVKLGVTTDTYDIWGKVLKTENVDITKDDVERILGEFTGEISQIPPMYSAIKQNGKKLYELARNGIEVERKARKITIYSNEISDFNNSEFLLRVSCSKGTYIRSLCNDIGEKLGCGACMTSLVRTKSSVFSLEEAVTFDELERLVSENGADKVLGCVDRIFDNLPSLRVNDVVRARLLNGAYSRLNVTSGMYRIYDTSDVFVGVASVMPGEKGQVLKIDKAFV